MTDGAACGTGCPTGQSCVNPGTCYLDCDPANQGTCPCDRFCAGLTDADGGVVGGVCVPGNAAGERCDTTFGKGGCAQALMCLTYAGGGYCGAYCASDADCPAQTFCADITSGGQPVGKACAYGNNAQGKAAGAACAATDVCVDGYLCDGTCKPQCDGPGGTCASGTCTKLADGAKTIGYVCK
jgi:hypothetical protein